MTIDPYRTFKFRIEIQGVLAGHFQNIDGMTNTMEVLEKPEPWGWEIIPNARDRAALDLAARSHGASAVIVRGWNPVQKKAITGEWKNPASAPRPLGVTGFIAENASAGPVRRWNFENAWPVKVTGPSVRAARQLPPDQLLLLFQGLKQAR
ncbi:MAG: hypothetical protein HKN21_12725 [Candidatus Eisenbacteria bacterium]|uniref:Phage tail protein n=1 Tax=Eiseniibacteriota bacterium TaxID=2212470 RepID=A0A7Y2E9B5_UNCEI|nr:hypothetical protein [Candidatus Eisenbacteria bacterium]